MYAFEPGANACGIETVELNIDNAHHYNEANQADIGEPCEHAKQQHNWQYKLGASPRQHNDLPREQVNR